MQGTSVPVELVSDPAHLPDRAGRALPGRRTHPGLVSRSRAYGDGHLGLVTDPDVTCMLVRWKRCRRDARPHLALIDFRRMEQVEPAHFERVFFLLRRIASASSRSSSDGVLRPKGFAGGRDRGVLPRCQTCHKPHLH